MKKNILKLLILLLIPLSVLAQNNYPKKLIIQNSKGKDTIIGYTNEQVEKFNLEHVALKNCVEYSNIQDTTIKNLSIQIESLQSLNYKLIEQDSISRESIEIQTFIIKQKELEKQQIQKSFQKYQKQVKKDKVKSWLYSNLVVTPIVVITTVLMIKFIK